jgi:transposase
MAQIFTASEKARIALEAWKGVDTLTKIASEHKAHPIQVGVWKKTLSEKAHTLFDIEHKDAQKVKEAEEKMQELYRIIGVRDAELVWLQKKMGP